MAKDEKTSLEVASQAVRALKDSKTPMKFKSIAGSALTQAPDKPKKKPMRFPRPK